MNQKWYEKSVVIGIFLIVFWPLGLLLMWLFAKWPTKNKWIVSGVFALIFILAILNRDAKSPDSTPTPTPVQIEQIKETARPTTKPTTKPKRELNTKVQLNNIAFKVFNNDTEDWTACVFEMNGGIIRGGYKYTTRIFTAGEDRTIPFREFTLGDGTRFDASETKPQKLSMSCKIGEERGFNYYDF